MTGYMIWFIATAAAIVAILTIGTLAAADLLGRNREPARADRPRDTALASGDQAAWDGQRHDNESRVQRPAA